MVHNVNTNVQHHHHHHIAENMEMDPQLQALLAKYGDKALDRFDKWDEKGEFADIQLKVMNGDKIGKKEFQILEKLSTKYPPELMQYAADKGLISQQDADMLIVAGGLFTNGADSRSDISKGLANFFSMPPHDRDFARAVMSDRPEDLTASDLKSSGKLKDTFDSPNPDQARLAYFLQNMEPGQQGWVQQFTSWNFDSGHSAMTAALGDIPDYNDMNNRQKDALAGFLSGLGSGWGASPPPPGGPHGPAHGPAHGPVGGPEHGRPNMAGCDFGIPGGQFGPGDMIGPDFVEVLGFSDISTIDLGSLMYQVMGDRIDSLDNQVREYAERVDEQNKAIATNTNAMIQLRTNLPDDGGMVDVTGMTFPDGNGNDVSLAGYLHEQGLTTDSTDLTKLNSSDINHLMDSISAKNDTLNSEATQDMTKLQQTMDKYQQAVSTLTNFEAKWHSMMQSVTGNLRS